MGKYKAKRANWLQIKPLVVYGSTFSYLTTYSNIYTQATSYYLNVNPNLGYLVYNTICSSISAPLTTSLSLATGPILTDLIASKQEDKAIMMFSKVLNFNNVLMGFGVGITSFLYPIYIVLVYAPVYDGVISILPYAILAIFFNTIMLKYRDYFSLTPSQPKMKWIELLTTGLSLVLALIGISLLGFSRIFFEFFNRKYICRCILLVPR